MIAVRILAVLAWLFASTLSVSAGEHDASHEHAKFSSDHGQHVMPVQMMGHDHAAMMKTHSSEQDNSNKIECEETCCDGLCLCDALIVSAAIEPAFVVLTNQGDAKRKFRIAHSGAASGSLLPEGPPPRPV